MITLDVRPHVWGVVGNLGGGKTLTAVSVIVDSLACGFFVVTNIELNKARLERRFGSNVYNHLLLLPPDNPLAISPWSWPVGSPRGMGDKRVIVVLDELAEWFDQYQNGGKGAVADLMSWLRHSSKQGQDVVLICQRLEYLSKSLRILIDRIVTVDDMASYRLPLIKIRAPFFLRPFILQRTFDRFGNTVDNNRWLFKSAYYRFYDTSQILGSHHNKSMQAYQSSPLSYHLFSFYWIWFWLFVICICLYGLTFWLLW